MSAPAGKPAPTVHVVDDDPAFAESVRWLLDSVGLEVALYASADAFLRAVGDDAVGCLVTDLRMPGLSGLELLRAMTARELALPVIVMTAHGDVDTAVQAMKDGAVDFIRKPFNDQAFLDLVNKAIAESLERNRAHSRRAGISKRLASLSPRERDVLDLVVEGRTNRAIADALAVSAKTVEAHRAHVMQKTGAGSLAELVKMVLAANGAAGKP